MTMIISDLEMSKVLDKETMATTRGGQSRLVTFQAERLTADKMYVVRGGCTSGTRSICHIDGTDDGDSLTLYA